MKVIETALPGVLIIEPKAFGDHRGFFLETFQVERYREAGITLPFVQDNHSRSQRGVLRGLHFQKTRPQGKLVSVSRGAVYDVAVDINPKSPTFGKLRGGRAQRRQSPPAMDSSGLRTWVLRDQRGGRLRVQMHRLLLSRR
jgi:dTDP-4-dehydrorhamnose 3,5-epimerase